MRTKFIVAAGLSFIALISPVFAAEPSVITDLQAVFDNGEIIVTVEPPSDAVYLRIYYSDSPIVATGKYDGFEDTESVNQMMLDGIRVVHTLKHQPPSQTVYLAATAVNTAGQESEGFVTEVRVDLFSEEGEIVEEEEPAPGSPSLVENFTIQDPADQEVVLIDRPVPEVTIDDHFSANLDNSTLHVLPVAESTDVDQFTVFFSASPMLGDPTLGPQAIRVFKGNEQIPLAAVVFRNNVAQIKLRYKQVQGAEYRIVFSDPIESIEGQPLDEENYFAVATGNAIGLAPGSEQEFDPPVVSTTVIIDDEEPVVEANHSSAPLPLIRLELNAQETENGYTINARWTPGNNLVDISHYLIRDHVAGQAPSEFREIGTEYDQLHINNVPAGDFALGITTILKNGLASQEVIETIRVGGSEAGAQAPIQVPPPTPIAPQHFGAPLQTANLVGNTVRPPNNLSSSGPVSTALMVLLFGSLLGAAPFVRWRVS